MLTILKRAVSWPDGDAIKTIQPPSSSTIRKYSKATVLPPLTVRLIPSMVPPAGAVHCSTDPDSRPSCDQQPASFRMVSMSEYDVVFENKEHDFPQRIIYRLVASGKLLGRIEGVVDGAERSADFPMTRTNCGNRNDSA